MNRRAGTVHCAPWKHRYLPGHQRSRADRPLSCQLASIQMSTRPNSGYIVELPRLCAVESVKIFFFLFVPLSWTLDSWAFVSGLPFSSLSLLVNRLVPRLLGSYYKLFLQRRSLKFFFILCFYYFIRPSPLHICLLSASAKSACDPLPPCCIPEPWTIPLKETTTNLALTLR